MLITSLTSLFVLICRFKFGCSTRIARVLRADQICLLLTFFAKVSLQCVLGFGRVVRRGVLCLSVNVCFFLFTILSNGMFFGRTVRRSLPCLNFLARPLFICFLLLLLDTVRLSQRAFALLRDRVGPSLLFLLDFIFIVLINSKLLVLPGTAIRKVRFMSTLFVSAASIYIAKLAAISITAAFARAKRVVVVFLVRVNNVKIVAFADFFTLSFVKRSSFADGLILGSVLGRSQIGKLFQIVLGVLFIALFVRNMKTCLVCLSVGKKLPKNARRRIFCTIFRTISTFYGTKVSALDKGVCSPLITRGCGLRI